MLCWHRWLERGKEKENRNGTNQDLWDRHSS
jgi:hypothetical protein